MTRPDVPRYSRISTRFWLDERSAHWTDEIKLAALYFMTCAHRTLEGIFLLPLPYAAADLRWTVKKVRRAIEVLTAESFLRFDPTTSTLLIRNALKYQAPENENQAKSCLRRIAAMPKSALLTEFLTLAQHHCSRKGASPYAHVFYQLLYQQLTQPLSEPLVPLNLNLNLNLQPKTNILNLQPQPRLTGDGDSDVFLPEGDSESELALRESRIPRTSLEVLLCRSPAGRDKT